MATTLTTDQKVRLTVAADSPDGSEIPADTVPVWTVDTTGKVALSPSPDGNFCDVEGVAVGATNTITVTVDALTDTTVIDVVSADPTDVSITVGTPSPKVDKQVTKGRGLGIGFAT